MSFYCNNCVAPTTNGCTPNPNIVIPCCPSAAYYRNLYSIDTCGRPIPKTIAYPLPVNTPEVWGSEAFGSVYTTASSVIDAGSNVVFSTVESSNLTSVTVNSITIQKPGNYQVSYFANTTSGGTLAITLNGTNVASSIGTSTDIISGNAILSLAQGDVIALSNIGTTSITLENTTLNPVSAKLQVVEID